MKKEEILKDLVEILTTFDNFCDNMYDRGSFCPCNADDEVIENFIIKMKTKYKVR
jgi:hypothetical protein